MLLVELSKAAAYYGGTEDDVQDIIVRFLEGQALKFNPARASFKSFIILCLKSHIKTRLMQQSYLDIQPEGSVSRWNGVEWDIWKDEVRGKFQGIKYEIFRCLVSENDDFEEYWEQKRGKKHRLTEIAKFLGCDVVLVYDVAAQLRKYL